MNGHQNDQDARRVARQEAVVTGNNPDPARDIVCHLSADVPKGFFRVRLRYVPDRLTLSMKAFDNYLTYLSDTPSSPEELAIVILDDMNNALVPRWVQIVVEGVDNGGAGRQRVLVQDRRPKWDNPALLSRLEDL